MARGRATGEQLRKQLPGSSPFPLALRLACFVVRRNTLGSSILIVPYTSGTATHQAPHRAAAGILASGTHKGALGPSLSPSGNTASFEGSFVVRTQPRRQQEQQQQQQQQQEQGADATAAEAANGDGKADQASEILGVEVWWSWDPIFLFRQLGWKEGSAQPSGEAAAEGAGDAAATADDVAAAEAALTAVDGATETAAAARAAYATEDEAVAAAEAAVAESAAAAERLAAGGGSLAEAQAANRRVVEMYFHTYNTGGWGAGGGEERGGCR